MADQAGIRIWNKFSWLSDYSLMIPIGDSKIPIGDSNLDRHILVVVEM